MNEPSPAEAERTIALPTLDLSFDSAPPTLGAGETAPSTDSIGLLPGYELIEPIGAGGFGTVFRAKQLKFDRPVAVKVLRRATRGAAMEAIAGEALALGRCQHPNVVQVFDFGEHEGRPYIVMELLEGEDLGRHVATAGPLGEREAWGLIRQAALGLAHAAERHMIHRDVKPANLFLVRHPGASPVVKVMDFGLARRGDSGTDAGRVAGTPIYMSPEQCRSSKGLTQRADIYSLGATAFQTLTGRPPFAGASPWEVLEQKVGPAPELGPGVSAASAALVRRMMDPDPERRPRSYAEVFAAIDAVLAGPPAAPTSRRGRRPRRRIAWAAGLAVAASLGAWASLPAGGPPDAGEYESAGRYEVLFDGKSLKGWRPSAGPWSVEPDGEGNKVIRGSGVIRRDLPRSACYRLTLGLDVHETGSAEVRVGRGAAVRVTREGAEFGEGEGEAFRTVGRRQPFPGAAGLQGKTPYLEVRLERSPGWWQAWFNDKPLGAARVSDTRGVEELVLVSRDGELRACEFQFQELTRRRR